MEAVFHFMIYIDGWMIKMISINDLSIDDCPNFNDYYILQ